MGVVKKVKKSKSVIKKPVIKKTSKKPTTVKKKTKITTEPLKDAIHFDDPDDVFAAIEKYVNLHKDKYFIICSDEMKRFGILGIIKKASLNVHTYNDNNPFQIYETQKEEEHFLFSLIYYSRYSASNMTSQALFSFHCPVHKIRVVEDVPYVMNKI